MGFFSWKTQDTNQSIPNCFSGEELLEVKMINPLTGEEYYEDEYEGYGEFGGKDYYELLAEINGYESDRQIGIELTFSKPKLKESLIFPKLVTASCSGSLTGFGEPETCEYQGYFYSFFE